MKHSLKLSCASLAFAALAFGAQAQTAGPGDIDFGDDSGLWANDGECDDPRFEGVGATDVKDDADLMADASDCRAAFLAGSVILSPATTESPPASDGPLLNAMPPRPSSSSNALSTETGTDTETDIDYGDDESFFATDGECDDARFIGAAMAEPPLLADDIGHDASDCKAGLDGGDLRLRGEGDPSIEEVTEEIDLSAEDQALLDELAVLFEDLEDADMTVDPADFDDPPEDGLMFNGVNFGDNASDWSKDGECDDPRFTGQGQTETTLLASDAFHDADDCLAAWKAGDLELAEF
ncbi:MAG: hypothetical protein WA989_02860 [Henriciella sp.]|uniref:hypothetical protein n=1 Tax=Henriciella sp. TaxID=1968823 RepID=UPI003C741964